MTIFNATATLTGNGALSTPAALAQSAGATVLWGVGRVFAPLTPPVNWSADILRQWPGTVGISAPPVPPPPDDIAPQGPYGQTSGISAPPWVAGQPPAIDPAVAALNARLVRLWGNQ